MTLFERGVQLYLVVITFLAALTIVWGTIRFGLEYTTTGTGWPVMIGIAVVLVLLGGLGRYRWTIPADESRPNQPPWSTRR